MQRFLVAGSLALGLMVFSGAVRAEEPKGKASAKRVNPVDWNHKHLRAILRMVKTSKKENMKQCEKIVKRAQAYARRQRKDFKKIRAAMKSLTKAEKKRLKKKAERLYGKLFNKYADAVMVFGENCHDALHNLELLIDDLMQLRQPGQGHKDDCGCGMHQH